MKKHLLSSSFLSMDLRIGRHHRFSAPLVCIFAILIVFSTIIIISSFLDEEDPEAGAKKSVMKQLQSLLLVYPAQSKKASGSCKNRTIRLIEEMRFQQTYATSNWVYSYPDLRHRWHIMADFFKPLVNDLKHNFFPFINLTDEELKHWLNMRNKNSPCNMVTIGVGEVLDGEKLIQQKYPQCNFLGIDPSATINKQLVESIPNSRFVHAAVSDKQTNLTVYEKDNGTYVYQNVSVVNFIDLLARENEGKLVDFLSIDAEGAEFAILPMIYRKRDELPKICQFNVELHFKDENYGHKLSEFMEVLRGFMTEAHFVLMNIDIYDYLQLDIMMRRLFFVNVVDEECVKKYLC